MRCARPWPRWRHTRRGSWASARRRRARPIATRSPAKSVSGRAAVLALIGFAVLLARYLALARPQRGADHGAARAAQDDAREHRRRGHHDRPAVARDRPQPRRRGAHRLEPRRRARPAARQGLSHRQRDEPRTDRDPDRARPCGTASSSVWPTTRCSSRKDGSEAPIDDSAAPICDSAGQVLGSVLVFRDISGAQGDRARPRRRARSPSAHRHRHGDPDHGLHRRRRGPCW